MEHYHPELRTAAMRSALNLEDVFSEYPKQNTVRTPELYLLTSRNPSCFANLSTTVRGRSAVGTR